MIAENIIAIKEIIKESCRHTGRNQDEVLLVVVSKTQPVSFIQEAYDAGIRDFGENKVQEIVEKYDTLPKDIRWHMIGHLQRNKVKSIIDKVVMIHSVDSIRLAHQIEEEAEKIDKTIEILLEINVSGECSKFGFPLEEAEEAIRTISRFSHTPISGLMTMAPLTENTEEIRAVFKKLQKFAVDMKSKSIDNVNMRVLSMGMTGDYPEAIEEGSTLVRVGTGIFGSR